MGSTDDGPLWAFATSIYARPGVEAALLALQDEDGLDVPLLLTLLYAGMRGIALAGDRLAALISLAAGWRDVIASLRWARRALKPAPDAAADPEQAALRAQVKTAELAAEHLLIGRLEAQLPAPGSCAPHDAVLANLAAYAKTLEPALSKSGEARLARLADLAR